MNTVNTELIQVFLMYILLCIILVLISYCFFGEDKEEDEINKNRIRKID